MQKPLVIIVSGAPGSGKTTCASMLAHHLQLPHLERDTVFRGIERTESKKVNRASRGFPAYYALAKCLLDNNISFVTDGTMYKGASEDDLKFHIIERSFAINVHTRAGGEKDRYRKREAERILGDDSWVEAHMVRLDEIYRDVVDPLGLGIPVIEVDTTNGYDPSVESILHRIIGLYSVC